MRVSMQDLLLPKSKKYNRDTMTPKKETKEDMNQSLAKLEKIVAWFDEQEQVDVEEGLNKVREGAVLVKELRARLKAVENEFEEVKKELASEEE